jgi:glutamate 5-kinase
MSNDKLFEIKNKIKNSERIVFKFGTNVLRNDDKDISLSRIYSFIEDVASLKKQGKEVIIVTSGAVGLGAKRLGVDSNESMSVKQACAAVGQSRLMSVYEDGFEKYGYTIAQILLTEEDFTQRIKYLSLHDTLNTLISLGAIPVINQNDTVSTEELAFYKDAFDICFSDNDKLSALVASELDADLLVVLSDIDGLYTDNPKTNPNATKISVVEEITEEFEKFASGAAAGGRGGMKTKLEAMKVVTRSGGTGLIANGKEPRIISRLFAQDNNEDLGTVFLPIETLTNKKRWIAYATNIQARFIVNDGAKNALIQKNTSLLPVGVLQIEGDCQKGDIVSIFDTEGNEFARGMVNYNCSDCKKIIGRHSDDIIDILGYKNYDALITRDNIALL